MSKATLIAAGIVLASIGQALAAGTAALAKGGPIRIGLVFDLSGRREPANDVVRGIEYAATTLKAQGVDILLEKYDSRSDGLGTHDAMQVLLKNPPDLIIAEIDSSKAVIAAEIAEKSHRVMITPYATSPVVTAGREYVFRGCFSDDFQGKRLAEFALHDLKLDTAALIIDGGQLYSKTLAQSFRQRFEVLGGKITGEETILDAALALGQPLERLLANKPKLLFMPVYEPTAARILNEISSKDLGGLAFMGGDGWGASGPFRDLVFAKQKALNAYWVSHYSGDLASPHLASIASSFKSQTGKDFNASSAIGYDTMMLAANAFRGLAAGVAQDQLRQAFHKMEPHQGLTGTVHFGKQQDPSKSLWLRKVGAGKMDFVKELRP